MTQKARVIAVVAVVVSVILFGGRPVNAGVEERKKIVIFLADVPLTVQQLVVALSGSTVVHTLSLINALAIELPLVGTVEALTFLLQHTLVVGVFDDLIGLANSITPLSAEAMPQEEIYDWGLERIGVAMVHQDRPALTGEGVTVAILDTGIDGEHAELQQHIVGGFNARPGGGRYTDDNGHGTHMAGIIAAAENAQGIVGVAPQANMVAVKVLDANGRGYLSDLINGLQWVYGKRFRLVNMSLGFLEDSVPLERAVKRLYERNIIMVAAAGNCTSGDGGAEEGGGDEGEKVSTTCSDAQPVMYPARYPWVIAVTAIDHNDQVTNYSRRGLEVDLAAPGGVRTGVQILSANRGGGYGYSSGTSQAAAHVTGAIALLLQQQPGLSLQQLLALLGQTATDLGYPEAWQGVGLLAVERLVEALQ
ncbi:MAG TPA: S8 family serine peptidase [Candidatus Tectomicrobia bacterium]|jgi:subtilisin family serine protease